MLWVGSNSVLDPTLKTSPKPYLQIGLSCRHPCHTWDLGFGTLCEVVSPNFHALHGWECMNWPQVICDLVWSGKSQLPCSRWLRLHGLTSSDLGLRTWDLVWSGKSQPPCSQWLRLHGLISSDLGLGIVCEVVSPNFHALNGWDCMDWPQVTWDLGFGTHVN